MILRLSAAAASLLILSAQPLSAEVVKADENGFVTRDSTIVEAEPKEIWLRLISPAEWWNSAHTWSGDAGNMSLRPQAGGCFCERIPESEDGEAFTLEGSVEHMRVIQSFPEKALRMSGGLGPLQSEAVNGVLTIVISKDEAGSRITFEYIVGGYMRYKTADIAVAVDRVLSQQLAGLAEGLDPVAIEPAPTDDDAAEEGEGEPSDETITPDEDVILNEEGDTQPAEESSEAPAEEPTETPAEQDTKSERELSLQKAIDALIDGERDNIDPN